MAWKWNKKQDDMKQSTLQIEGENGNFRDSTASDFFDLVEQKKREQTESGVESAKREIEGKWSNKESVKDKITPDYGEDAYRTEDFGYNAFKNGLDGSRGLQNSQWNRSLTELGGVKDILSAGVGALGNKSNGVGSTRKSYTPKVNVGSAAETLKKLSNERAAGLMQAAGMGNQEGQPEQQSQAENSALGYREITDHFFQDVLGDGADQQKQTYGAYMMRDPEFIGSLSTDEIGMLQKSAGRYADEIDKTRWMKQAKLAELEENGYMPEELEAYQKEIDELQTLGELWRDGEQRLDWQKNIAERQAQIDTTEAGARGAADFAQVAAVGSSRGKDLSDGELQQYNLWLQYGQPDGVSFQEYWEDNSAWTDRAVPKTRQQKKSDEIQMGMMAAETARAKDVYDASRMGLQMAQQAYDAAMLDVERASSRLYDADYEEFDQAVEDYNTAMDNFKRAEERLNQAKRQSKQGSKEEKQRLQQAQKDEAEVSKLLKRESYPDNVNGRKEEGPEEPNPLEFYLAYSSQYRYKIMGQIKN